jgi:hypothetical protein
MTFTKRPSNIELSGTVICLYPLAWVHLEMLPSANGELRFTSEAKGSKRRRGAVNREKFHIDHLPLFSTVL